MWQQSVQLLWFLESEVKVSQSCPTLCNPMDYTVHGILQARILEWIAFPFSRGSSQPRDQTQVSCIAGGFFTTESPGKPLKGSEKWSESHSVVSNSLQPHGLYSPWISPGQNTGVGSHFFFWVIFPSQGSNPDLPHCRWILYQLSHQGSPWGIKRERRLVEVIP